MKLIGYVHAKRCAVVLGVVLACGPLAPRVPVQAQEAQAIPSCPLAARVLTGDWTTTETVDGQNTSLWRGTLRLVQRGMTVVGRWEPPDFAPERAVFGALAEGVLRVTVRGAEAQPAAAVAAAPARTWLLTLSSDGTLLTGRWSEPAAPGAQVERAGTLVAAGEAGCRDGRADAADSQSAGQPVQRSPSAPAAPAPPPSLLGETPPAQADSACLAWDVSGTWETPAASDGGTPWHLHLWQDGAAVLGWYEPAAPPTSERAPAWVVDGTLRGRTLFLTHYLGDSTTLARTLLLDPAGAELAGTWPLPFGPDEREVLRGRAYCLAG